MALQLGNNAETNTARNIVRGERNGKCVSLAFTCFLLIFLLFPFQTSKALLLLETDTLWDGAAPELAISSIILNGQDLRSDAVVAFSGPGKETYIDLAEFTQALGLELSEHENHYLIETPIGFATLAPHVLRQLDGRAMVELSVLGRHLASDVIFDASEYAVQVDVPWPLDEPVPSAEIVRPSGAAESDIDAPTASVSFVRTEYLQRFENGSDTSSIVSDVGGSLFDGYWQVRVRDYLENDPFIEDYIWLQSGRQHRFLLGNQTVGLDPLLQGFEFTGAQAAWTNRPISLFTDSVQAEQIITNQNGSIRTFTGQGPPGGRAELRIEGVPVASTIIALDGRFEFRDVELPSGNIVNVEAWLFERGSEGVPADVLDFSGYATNRVLPAGTFLLQSGAGVDGNLIEDSRGGLDATGFVSGRYAPWDEVTFNTAYQHVQGRDAALTGASVSLGSLGFISGQIAHADGEQAWRVEAENRQRHWFWRGFAQSQPDGWFDRTGDLDDVFAELGYRFNDQWQLSLVGRDFSSADDDFEYLLPALQWRPSQSLLLIARPDFDGDYTGQAYWRVDKDNSINAFANQDESSVQWLNRVNGRDTLMVQVLDRDNLGQRISTVYRRAPGGLRSLGWGLGVLFGEGELGYLAQADYEFIPGLRARAEAFRDPFSGVFGVAETVVSLSVVANFNIAGGRISRGSFRRELLDRGNISGAIDVPDAFDDRFDLAGVAVMVNNQVRTRTEDGGRFTIPFLDPGIYRVRLDLDGLPLELRPKQDGFWVEVAAGSASFVRFDTDVLLGFAGQIRDEQGCPLVAQSVDILSQQGELISQVKTSDFGYYRVDNLAPDTYRLRLSAEPENQRDVVLTNDFQFNQDLISGQLQHCEPQS